MFNLTAEEGKTRGFSFESTNLGGANTWIYLNVIKMEKFKKKNILQLCTKHPSLRVNVRLTVTSF